METNPYVLEYVELRDFLGGLYGNVGEALEKESSIPKRFFREYKHNGARIGFFELKEKVGLAKRISDKMLKLEDIIPKYYDGYFKKTVGEYVKPYLHRDFTFENLYSICLENSLNALRKYNPIHKGEPIKFITYLNRWIRGGISVYVRNVLRKKQELFSSDDFIQDGSETTFIEGIFDSSNLSAEELVVKKENLNVFLVIDSLRSKKNCLGLTEKERFVLKKRYGESKVVPLRVLGEDLNVSRERIRQIETAAMRKLGRYMRRHNLTKEDFI